jgi:F-type H+-transporting ATPase subunit delta
MSPAGMRLPHLAADVTALRLARTYAEALLRVAERHGQVAELGEALDSLIDEVFPAEPRLEALLASPAVPQRVKAELLTRTFAPQAGVLFTNFLGVLNDHGRLDLLRLIRTAWHQLLDERARRIRVEVRSAVPLAEEQRQRLRETLRQLLDREPVLEERHDDRLLAGLMVRVGDWLYDASLRTRLLQLRNYLLARATYEIQSGRDRFCLDS